LAYPYENRENHKAIILQNMATHQDIVLLFTRFPTPGTSKTRLIPILGDQGAADLQKRLTEHALLEVTRLKAHTPIDLEIHFVGGNETSMQSWLGPHHIYKRQSEGNIGDKMAQAMASHLGRKGGIILIGSDLPGITTHILTEALLMLNDSDLVIGPAHDGGYYLIGVNGSLRADILSSLFSDIPWGSSDVFAGTLAKVRQHQLIPHILPILHDIDRPEDLRHLDHNPGA
jgi:rSAM/selenodomain-associated transferase 1